jgi:hypothetical protein
MSFGRMTLPVYFADGLYIAMSNDEVTIEIKKEF